ILDDPVVDHRDVATTVHVRMRIPRRRSTVRRPTRVRNPIRPLQRTGTLEQLLEAAQPTGDLVRREGVGRRDTEADGIIAEIFEPPQTGQEDGQRRTLTDVTYDPAHFLLLPFHLLASIPDCPSSPRPDLCVR